MIYLNFFNFIAIIVFGGAALFLLIYLYMIVFEAEKFRKKMVALPEYKPTWVLWATPFIPYKWWHFYRKAVFLYFIDPVFISKKQRRKSVAARKITEIMPRHLVNLYRIQDFSLFAWAISLAIWYFSN